MIVQQGYGQPRFCSIESYLLFVKEKFIFDLVFIILNINLFFIFVILILVTCIMDPRKTKNSEKNDAEQQNESMTTENQTNHADPNEEEVSDSTLDSDSKNKTDEEKEEISGKIDNENAMEKRIQEAVMKTLSTTLSSLFTNGQLQGNQQSFRPALTYVPPNFSKEEKLPRQSNYNSWKTKLERGLQSQNLLSYLLVKMEKSKTYRSTFTRQEMHKLFNVRYSKH